MSPVSEYCLSFRIKADAAECDALDAATGLVGTRREIGRKKDRLSPGQGVNCWELEAVHEGGTYFSSLDEAVRALGISGVASSVRRAAFGSIRSYWWCGCFHSGSTARTRITRAVLETIGASGAPLIFNTFHAAEAEDASDEEMSRVEQEVAGDPDDQPGHRYRFILSDTDLSFSESAWSDCFEDFSVGLRSQLRMLETDGHIPGRKGAVLICEHMQYAFDGGPEVAADHAGLMASLGLQLLILWRSGWSFGVSSADPRSW